MKKASKGQIHCDKHEFSLKPKSEYLLQAQNYSVSFCNDTVNKVNKKGKPTLTGACQNFPSFNTDGNHATPSFILPSEKSYYEVRGEKIREDHEKRFVDCYCDDKSSLNVPKPRTKSYFCNVCRTNYEDYLEHVNNAIHHRKINQSLFNRYILELTQKYQHSQPPTITKLKTVEQDKTNTNINIDDDDQVQIISNPHKMVKPNQTLSLKDLQKHENIGGNPQVNFNSVLTAPVPQYSFPTNLQTIYHQRMNEFAMGYNMNLYMNSYCFLPSNLTVGYPQLYNYPFMQSPFAGFDFSCPTKPKEVCIVIDE